MKPDASFETLVLAALLHDIGKFMERAGDELTPEDKKLIPSCCPSYQGHSSHYHLLRSGRFVREFLGSGYNEVQHLALYHHRPDSYEGDKRLSLAIALADRLSSGERERREEGDTGQPGKEPLFSIFSRLEPLGGVPESPEPACFPLRPLNPDLSELFPIKEALLSEGDYARLWSAFAAEAKKSGIKGEKFENLLPKMLSLLEKYTIFIPSAVYKDVPDVSLFQHLRNTAAIAACIHRAGISEEQLTGILEALAKKARPKVLQESGLALVAGDISGIQDFIYSITSRHALKGLRGRSFYIQLLSETLARSLLAALDLPETNLLYNAGGNFRILAPNLPSLEKTISTIQVDFDRTLLKAHRGALNALLVSTPVSWNDFLGTSFGDAWGRAAIRLGREKKRKLHHLTGGHYAEVFGPYEEGGEKPACSVCGRELERTSKDSDTCALCASLQELAGEMGRPYLRLQPIAKPATSKPIAGWRELLTDLGWDVSFQGSGDQWSYRINQPDIVPETRGFRFLARHIAGGMEGLVTLEELADRAVGIKKWGVLKADVDNLGKLFTERLENNNSISRVTTASYLLHLFFSLGVEKILEKEEYRDTTYLAYSGGDDLFLVGSWSVLPDLALEIRNEFTRFTSNNLTLSAGIFLAPSKSFPVHQAARAAGKAEDSAKSGKKNQVALFDEETPVPWNDFVRVSENRNRLVAINTKGAPRSLFTLLYAGWQEKKLVAEGEISMERIWRLLYGLKRIFTKKEEQELINEIRDNFITDQQLRPHLNIAVRWAEYLTRKE